MVWLDEADLDAAQSLGSAFDRAIDSDALLSLAACELARLVGADCWSVNLVSLPSGAVQHEAMPPGVEPTGAFSELVSGAFRHPLLWPHAVRPRAAVRLSDAVEPRRLSASALYAELLHRSEGDYGISISVRPHARETVVFALGRAERDFSERDRDVLDVARGPLQTAVREAGARRRAERALAAQSPGTAVVLLDEHGEILRSTPPAERWLAEHFGGAEHPSWLPEPVASWLALPPRPPLVSTREGRRLTVTLVPGHPHALLLEEDVERLRAEALEPLGLTAREREVLDAALQIDDEAALADQLFLSAHAVRERLERVEQKLGVHTLAEAVAAALRASA
ncbi:MAG TPA: LuxR C-terminal-related transcriptional regulator [Solirubrobacteraceae bacterium]|nr:LuxR C-terminal-related transcriptional regulator [Solirubrobacteraceae bacterium]